MPPSEFCNPAVALPQLHVLAVNQSHGAVLRFIFVCADQINAVEDVAVRAHDVRTILWHNLHSGLEFSCDCRNMEIRQKMRKNGFCSRSGTMATKTISPSSSGPRRTWVAPPVLDERDIGSLCPPSQNIFHYCPESAAFLRCSATELGA